MLNFINYFNMGNKQVKPEYNVSKKTYINEEVKSEYFKYAKKVFINDIRKINKTIHHNQNVSNNNLSPNNEVSKLGYSTDSWINYLIEKIREHYQNPGITNNKSKDSILKFLCTIEETNEAKHIYNLSIFLSEEINDLNNSKKQSINIITI